ncbi:MAG TPA: outer membrane lipoprotein carrier protein LolA [Bacteroidales bacterium]|nr:outer membrane lipoprotein carrier protein LolA [Bacteroidales bacterium]HOH21791.1 outer membrane lipoprotein carrier protein LolA [Bacteroidales bacterium]HPB57958.1 outer membrane lipoprotein carrier protein LolA [Bacteroidales bacterium]HPZ02930.1 outer membrane lipoprotein carrier protein LolA [Bacteroidales bacterium]HQB74188.1 outer membrane lipoprotein carrier protein LolA [Bacteroidales bacterium]
MKKTIISWIALISFSLLLFTLKGQTTVDKDQGAGTILEGVLAKYDSYSTMNIDFQFQTKKEKKTVSSLTGKLIIKKEKYHASLDGDIYACDKESVWNYQKNGNEVNIYEYDEADIPIFHPTKFLAHWKKEFKARFIREETKNGRILQIIDLIPLKNNSYYKIRIYIDKSKKEVTQTEIHDKDNTIYLYKITKLVPNGTINDQIFSFKKEQYPGVEINDMR